MGSTLNLLLVLAWIGIVGTVAGLVAALALRLPTDVGVVLGIVVVLLVGVIKWPVWLFRLIFRQEPVHWADTQPDPVTLVRTWRGRNQADAVRAYARTAERLGQDGWEPVSQSWAPGQRGLFDYLIGIAFAFTGIGIVILVYFFLVPPSGTLVVTFHRRVVRVVTPVAPEAGTAIAAGGPGAMPAAAPPTIAPPRAVAGTGGAFPAGPAHLPPPS